MVKSLADSEFIYHFRGDAKWGIGEKSHEKCIVGCIDSFGRWTVNVQQMIWNHLSGDPAYGGVYSNRNKNCIYLHSRELCDEEPNLPNSNERPSMAKWDVCIACGVCITNIQVSMEIFTAIRICRTPKCYAWRVEIHGFDWTLMTLWWPVSIGNKKKTGNLFSIHFLFFIFIHVKIGLSFFIIIY